MKKIVSILLIILLILAISTLILSAEEIESTFQNEPDGFRGLKWGDAPTEDMRFLGEISVYGIVLGKSISTKSNSYYRRDDKNNIGTAKLDHICYRFNLYSNQFYKVIATFYGEDNYDILKIICEERFGKPTYMWEKKDYFLRWVGDKTEIILYFNSKKRDDWYHKGWIEFKSVEIHPEKIEDNKQKEAEKAKEDF
jgi:hypothetical protein